MSAFSSKLRLRGFSLIELLTVVAILSVTLAMTLPAISELMRASGIANAGDQLVSTLGIARQTSMALNRTVEVRLYKYEEPGDPPSGRFRGIQVFVLEPSKNGTATNAIGRKITLPSTICISENPTLSSLLGSSVTKRTPGSSTSHSIQPCGLNYEYASFQFFPNGSTSLTNTTPLFVTVIQENISDTVATPPDNFATILINRMTGKIQLYRP